MKGISNHLPQTPAGFELAARSPAKTLGGSKFLIHRCQNTGINVWKWNSAFFLPLLYFIYLFAFALIDGKIQF